MKHTEGTFKGVRQLDVYYQGWLPDGDVKGVLFIVHGLGEHSGRYGNVVDYFVPKGYAIYGFDQIGHGKSAGGREEIERFEDFTTNISIYYEMVKAWQPGKPIFMYGHSLGGLIAAYYLIDEQARFTGAIISAPMTIVPDNISNTTVLMGRILSKLAPKMGIIPLNAEGVSSDPAVVKAYTEDPLVFHGKTPARLAAETLRAMQRVTADVKKITLPFIVLQGSADKLVAPDGGELLYDEASSKDKTIKYYKDFYHEVHNEPGRVQVFRDVEGWLKDHV